MTVMIGQWTDSQESRLDKDSKEDMNNMLSKSRNILRIDDYSMCKHYIYLIVYIEMKNILIRNRNEIQSFFNNFPATQHDLHNLVIDASLTVIPTQNNASLFTLSIHGRLKLNNFLRGFDRTLILGPPTQPDLPASILNDQLHLRPPSLVDIKAMTSSNPLTIGPTSPQHSGPVQPSIPVNQLSQDQQLKIKQLSNETRLNVPYSMLCLQQANWDLGVARGLAQQSRHNLPPDAFLQ